MSDALTITDSAPSLVLNDVNTLFHTLSDALIADDSSLSIAVQPVLTDSLAFSATIAFGLELSLFGNCAVDDNFPHITGLLFGFESINDSLTYIDTVASGEERDSVYETGDYGSSDVFVHTDLVNVGVFE